ncbi:ABC transporter substrate-binding protein [Streptomyces acidiscabies]|uniref:Sugar ABC transporter substrate-binding protein n=1 Tax=Streptomyces acidiscabies TaxID=42234 RepID=A0AAP6EFV7_9ACTN|nr:sugar ABC transporter substrate-binding protein [Streptomyces acidiscabies]MBP5935028.1 sugar ABC transporter substrate-binding protein [Streptomyces sp. LBUM 1476]MBZ3917187.1 sugar ABC transporter substrate-binding protein [Streptomyces acidiscabies]MDX2961427.1 sugar ABC transporter substrate-binding protein [Streptomyces acidiscabies]MDX3023215.1 sugar ABC transporter substrate-binding protein [Streptomyces acidiscabies]MDX3792149.1 sugar ABC transporter substrate-binding protein [Strep
MRSTTRRVASGAVALLAAASLATACGSSGGGGGGGGKSSGDVDDGAKLTMWTRAATRPQSEALVKAYNDSHKNKVELTVVPTDDYQAKVGAAAGSRELPDLFASDVVFVPNYTSSGLFADLTSRIDALPFASKLAQSHIKAGTHDGKKYVVPHTLDLSVLFYNKSLYKQAKLDPEKPPTTLAEWDQQARAVNALGGGVNGTFFGGNCGGCGVFTWWPSIWAAGQEVLNDDGTAATLDSPAAKKVYDVYRGWVKDGILAPGAKEETGTTWTGVFPKGKVGVMPMPSTTLGLMPKNLDLGVAPIPGPDGGKSTFVGGDAIGIAATSKNADQAWNFLAWSLGDDAQVNVVAAHKDVVARTDLASNKFSAADPRLVTVNQLVADGRTPYALKFGQTFNDPNGPWLKLMRDAVFGDGSGIDKDNKEVSASLAD